MFFHSGSRVLNCSITVSIHFDYLINGLPSMSCRVVVFFPPFVMKYFEVLCNYENNPFFVELPVHKPIR